MNNICKDITCERLNNCPYENDEILYCPGYLNTTKIESAWEMFRRLANKYGSEFHSKVNNKTRDKNTLNTSTRILIFYNEQDAIKIMQEIEKELKNEKN